MDNGLWIVETGEGMDKGLWIVETWEGWIKVFG